MRRLMRQPIVFDGRNVFDPARMVALGFTYQGIGRAAPGSGIRLNLGKSQGLPPTPSTFLPQFGRLSRSHTRSASKVPRTQILERHPVLRRAVASSFRHVTKCYWVLLKSKKRLSSTRVPQPAHTSLLHRSLALTPRPPRALGGFRCNQIATCVRLQSMRRPSKSPPQAPDRLCVTPQSGRATMTIRRRARTYALSRWVNLEFSADFGGHDDRNECIDRRM